MLDWAQVEELPELTIEALKAAAKSFPAGTGLGVDNISPRAFLRLSDEALTALTKLLMVIEKRESGPPRSTSSSSHYWLKVTACSGLLACSPRSLEYG